MSKLVLFSGDLMLGARVEGAARKCELAMVTCASSESAITAAADECLVVLIDLRTPGINLAELVESLRQPPTNTTIIACAPHVHTERLEAARQAGCDLIVTRGQLDREADAIFQRIVDEA
jgi:CheY-like chemotaxis protein